MNSKLPTGTQTTVVLGAETTAPGNTGPLPLPGQYSNALPVGTHVAEFELTGLVGEGGFGIVYLAYDHSLHRQVAVKEYIPSSLANRTTQNAVAVISDQHVEPFQAGLASFINEARLLAQFDHPSLLKVYRFWEANGTAYMAMPFYEGITLKKTLKNLGGPPDEEWLKHLLVPLLDALGVMHAAQCFHRDIAPDNILILANGRPVLLDFGAARRVIADMTQAPTVILKPGYAPVEQYGEDPTMRQGPWTDIYALAAVVYSAIVGKAPQASISRYMSDAYRPVAKLAAGRYSEQFLRAVDLALSVIPGDRPQSVDEFRALLGVSERRARPRAATPTLAPGSTGLLPEAIASATPESLMRTEPHTPAAQHLSRPAPATEATLPWPAPPSAAATVATPETPKVRIELKEGGPLKVYVLTGILLIGFVGLLAWMYLPRAKPAADKSATVQTAPALPDTHGVPPSESTRPAGLEAKPAESKTAEPAAPQPQLPPTPHAEPTPAVEPARPSEAQAPRATEARAPSIPPTAPPVPAMPLTTAELFEQVLAARDPQRVVTATAENPQVGIGRGVSRFAVSSSAPGYLYVLRLGADAEDIQLVFPNLADQRNRIGPERPVSQPSPGWSRPVEGPAGVDRYIAIVSDQPRDFGLLDARARGLFRVFRGESLARLQRSYTGTLPLLAGTVVCPVGASCRQTYGAASFSVEKVIAPPPERIPTPVAEKIPPPAAEPKPPPATASGQADKRASLAAREKPSQRTPASERSSAKITTSSRCSDILERASLGEPLSPEQMSYLRRECGR